MATGGEGVVAAFPSPDAVWDITFAEASAWRDRFVAMEPEDRPGSWALRYYQESAVSHVLERVADDVSQILPTLATARQDLDNVAGRMESIQVTLDHRRDAGRQPCIQFLADRNTLANPAFNGNRFW